MIAALSLGAAFAGCKPQSQAEKYSTDELRRFEQEQQPRLDKREARLDEAKVERQASAQKEIAQINENIAEERAENLGEHQEELAELEHDINADDPGAGIPSPIKSAKIVREANPPPDAGTPR